MDFSQYSQAFSQQALLKGYTGDEIAEMLDYAKILNERQLPIIYDQEHLALLLGFQLPYLLSMSNGQRHFYRSFKLPKRNGGFRIINQPLPNLREAQEWILENILNAASSFLVSYSATAFIPGKSLRSNVEKHQGKKKIVALDIKDFFDTVKFSQVYDVFTHMGYCDSVSMLLAKLCVLRNSLPQGAPTSPMLSNMVFFRIDNMLEGYCERRGITYTRYADDLIFSGDNINAGLLIRHVRFLTSKRYELNNKKTKVMGQASAQYVTGIVVNAKAQAPRRYRQRIRQEVYYIKQKGIDYHFSHVKNLPVWITKPEVYLNHLLGKINFVLQINPDDREFLGYRRCLKGLVYGKKDQQTAQ